jgi:ELWxxDGT repeat protein
MPDLHPGSGDAFALDHLSPDMVVYDHRLFFAADDGGGGYSLWAFDAATGQAALISDETPELLAVYDDRLFFLTRMSELLAYDAATDEVAPIASFDGGAASSESGGIAVYDGRLFFQADDDVAGQELWAHDAATGETALAADIWPGGQSGSPDYLTVYDGRLYFSARDERLFEDYDDELWFYDAATGEASQAAEIFPGVEGSNPRFLTVYDGYLYFNARDTSSDYELWRFGPAIPPGCDLDLLSADLAYDAGTRRLCVSFTARNDGDDPAAARLELDYDRDGGAPMGTRDIGSGTLPAGAQVTQTVCLRVPAGAPGGDYNFTLRLVDADTGGDCATYQETLAISAPRWSGEAATRGGLFEVEEVADLAPSASASSGRVGVSPNPFTRQATITYDVAAPAAVRLAVYDVLGREVAVLVDGYVEAGVHQATFDGGGLASGTYVYRLVIGNDVQVGRMTLAP